MTIAFLPGSFDPPTKGHISLMERAAALFSRLYIGVADNSSKKTSLLPLNERTRLLQELLSHLPNVEILSFNGLTVDCAEKKGAHLLVRGARNGFEYETEVSRAHANYQLSKLQTCIIPADPSIMHISSSLVREILAAKGPLEAFLPRLVIDALRND
jgi:pantetheine-phosphate adenylyltransferase